MLATFYWEKAFKDLRLSPAREAALHRRGHRRHRSRPRIRPRLRRCAHLQEHPPAHEGEHGGRPRQQAGTRCRGRCVAQPRDGAAEDPPDAAVPTWPSCRRPVSRRHLRRLRLRRSSSSTVRRQSGWAGTSSRRPRRGTSSLSTLRRLSHARVQGVVIIEATIDSLGNVSTARVLRGQPLLDQAALDAVKEWQFTPTMMNGVAVPVIMTVTVNFTMDRAAGGPGGPPELSGRRRPRRLRRRRSSSTARRRFASAGTSSRPRRLRDVKPIYPADAMADRVQGVVVIEATIDSDGKCSERARAPQPAAARSGRRRRRQSVAVHTDAAEWRGRARDHDGDGEFHAGQ